MKAEEVEAGRLFQTDQQLRIPLWQRRYSWDTPQWDDLWHDICRLRDGELQTHFLGSIVLKTLDWTGSPSEAHQFWVVDGQQRVTTLTLLVTAIRDRIAQMEATPDERRAESDRFTSRLLLNTNLKPQYRQRLLLQEPDASSLAAILEGSAGTAGQSAIERCYEYFRGALQELSAEEAEALLATVLRKMSAVWVTLEADDNAHRVFQTLNAGGKPLQQSDLVRNYFFLLLGEEGEDFYRSKWRFLEQDLSPRELEEYFVAWTITQGYTGGKASLFGYFQRDLGPHESNRQSILDYGEQLTVTARYFTWIRRPELSEIGSAKTTLDDLARWGTTPAEGLLLWLLRAHAGGLLNDHELRQAFEYILSFLARRLLAGFEPQTHKSIFVATVHRLRSRDDLRGPEISEFLRYLLSRGEDVRQWPHDEVVRQRALTSPLYTRSRSAWVFTVLDRINRSLFTHPEHAPQLRSTDYSVEHVMPQRLTPRWARDLQDWGVDNVAEFHQNKLHVLGNLTITRINSTLSNRAFEDKRADLGDDWLRINREIAKSHEWNEQVIDDRSDVLANIACHLFPRPYSRAEMDELRDELEQDRADEQLDDIEAELDEIDSV